MAAEFANHLSHHARRDTAPGRFTRVATPGTLGESQVALPSETRAGIKAVRTYVDGNPFADTIVVMDPEALPLVSWPRSRCVA